MRSRYLGGSPSCIAIEDRDDSIGIDEAFFTERHNFPLAGPLNEETFMGKLMERVTNWHAACVESLAQSGLHEMSSRRNNAMDDLISELRRYLGA
jgi:hypothetical protein